MAHDPIQFGPAQESETANTARPQRPSPGGQTRGGAGVRPRHLDLKKDAALTIQWSDGRVSIYPIAYLRRMSPSADARKLRDDLEKNPLTVLPSGGGDGSGGGPLTATGAEMVGNYALRVYFSDGHDTGIYSWDYLRSIDPNQAEEGDAAAPPNADEHVKP